MPVIVWGAKIELLTLLTYYLMYILLPKNSPKTGDFKPKTHKNYNSSFDYFYNSSQFSNLLNVKNLRGFFVYIKEMLKSYNKYIFVFRVKCQNSIGVNRSLILVNIRNPYKNLIFLFFNSVYFSLLWD